MSQSHSEQYESKENIYKSIFEELVMEMGQTGLFFLGLINDPETGETVSNIPGAKHIVDQLEMLAFKTNGNLSPSESHLIDSTLNNLRDALGQQLQKIDN